MSAGFEWALARGGRILFVAHDDDTGLYDIDHWSRDDTSCGRVAVGLPLAEAEAAAENWLRQAGQSRLLIIAGGRHA